MPENGQNEEKRRLVPSQNGLKVIDSNSNQKIQHRFDLEYNDRVTITLGLDSSHCTYTTTVGND